MEKPKLKLVDHDPFEPNWTRAQPQLKPVDYNPFPTGAYTPQPAPAPTPAEKQDEKLMATFSDDEKRHVGMEMLKPKMWKQQGVDYTKSGPFKDTKTFEQDQRDEAAMGSGSLKGLKALEWEFDQELHNPRRGKHPSAGVGSDKPRSISLRPVDHDPFSEAM